MLVALQLLHPQRDLLHGSVQLLALGLLLLWGEGLVGADGLLQGDELVVLEAQFLKVPLGCTDGLPDLTIGRMLPRLSRLLALELCLAPRLLSTSESALANDVREDLDLASQLLDLLVLNGEGITLVLGEAKELMILLLQTLLQIRLTLS